MDIQFPHLSFLSRFRYLDAQMVEYIFECHLQTIVPIQADQAKQLTVLYTESRFQVNCPAVVFVLLPNNDKAL